MGNKEQKTVFGFTPNKNAIDRLREVPGDDVPADKPIDINSILNQINQARPSLTTRKPHFRR